MTDQLTDERSLPIFIHSELDDFGLTSRTFRVYAHLARRAGRGGAWPSYNSMGRVCFSPDLPTAQPGTWRRMAIQAVKELVTAGLIVKEVRQGEDGNNKTNIYKLTPKERWDPSALSLPSDGGTLPSDGGTLPSDGGTLPSDNAPKGDPLEITPPGNESKEESTKATPVRSFSLSQDVSILSQKLQSVGVGVTEYIIDEYMAMVKDFGIEAVVRGITSAADNNKQHRKSYVAACIRNIAEGFTPQSSNGTQPKKNGSDIGYLHTAAADAVAEVRARAATGGNDDANITI